MSRLATNNPTHRRIMTEALGIVYVLVSGKPTEHGLPQQTDQRMAAVLASARIGEHLPRQRGQPERIVKFAIGEQPGIGRDHGATKLEHQAAIKIEPDGIRFRFTCWVRHRRLPPSRISRCALYLNRGHRWRNQSVIRGMQVGSSSPTCPASQSGLPKLTCEHRSKRRGTAATPLLADLLHLIAGGIVGSMPLSRTQQQTADLFQATGAQESFRAHTP